MSDHPHINLGNAGEGKAKHSLPCACGCGEAPPLATRTRPHLGTVAGEPVRFVHGHQTRLPRRKGVDHVEQECGYSTPCWVWQHGKTGDGYAHCSSADHPSRYAHRWYYERHVEPIPEGMTIDHLCRNRACVNPDHLEVVTVAENSRRATNLTPDHVIARVVDALRAGWSRREIGAAFGLSYPTITAVSHALRWHAAGLLDEETDA